MSVSGVDLSILLPAYEEAESLRSLLPALVGVATGLGVRWEIVVVDAERPRDATAEVCAAHGARCVSRRGGDTYGDAVRTGLPLTRGAWVLVMDADGSHALEDVPRLWAERERADVVIGSRYVPGGATEVPLGLTLASRVLNGVYRTVLGVPCADMSNSFRVYRGDDVRGLRVTGRDFDVVEELLVRLVRSRPGVRIVEVPVRFRRRSTGRSKRAWGRFVVSYVRMLGRLGGLA